MPSPGPTIDLRTSPGRPSNLDGPSSDRVRTLPSPPVSGPTISTAPLAHDEDPSSQSTPPPRHLSPIPGSDETTFFPEHDGDARCTPKPPSGKLRRSPSSASSSSHSRPTTMGRSFSNPFSTHHVPGELASEEDRRGYLTAMDTIKYIGTDKATDVILSLRILSPFCGMLHERMSWLSSPSRKRSPAGSPDEQIDPELASVAMIAKLTGPDDLDEASRQAALASRTERNRRAAILSTGLTESDLPAPETEAYRITKEYTVSKMSRKSSAGAGSRKGSFGKVTNGGPGGLPFLKPKEAAEVGAKLEVLEEAVSAQYDAFARNITMGQAQGASLAGLGLADLARMRSLTPPLFSTIQLASYGYLPVFDLVRRTCYLPPRSTSSSYPSPSPSPSPSRSSSTSALASSATSLSSSGRRTPSDPAKSVTPLNVVEAFDLGGIMGSQRQRRRGSDAQVRSGTLWASMGTPKTPERSRPSTADSTGRTFKLRPFGSASKSMKGGHVQDGKLPSHRSTGSMVELTSDDEEFGSPGPMTADRSPTSPLGSRANVSLNDKTAKQRKLSLGSPSHIAHPPSAYRPQADHSSSHSGGFYIPGSSNASSTSLSGAQLADYSSPRQSQMFLPSGPSTFRLPMARQESGTFGRAQRQRSGSLLGVPLLTPDTDGMTGGTFNSPIADDSRDPFDADAALANGSQTPPDLSVPPRARRHELLVAAGLAPAPEDDRMKGLGVDTSCTNGPPLPTAPMPLTLGSGEMPSSIGVRRPRMRAGSGGSGRSNFNEGDISMRRRAIIVLDEADEGDRSCLPFDGGVSLGSLTESISPSSDTSDVGLALSPETSPHSARPGRIKSADEMLAALTSRRSSLGPSEPKFAPAIRAIATASQQVASPGLIPSASASRRLSDLLEEEAGEEGEDYHFQDEAAKRHTAGTQFSSTEGHSVYASPSMITDTSSNRNSTQFSSGSHDHHFETFSPSSGYPQTPHLSNDFSSAYTHEADVLEAGKQMLYDVFGGDWDQETKYERLAEDARSMHIGQRHGGGMVHESVTGPRVAERQMLQDSTKQWPNVVMGAGRERPDSTLYPAWI